MLAKRMYTLSVVIRPPPLPLSGEDSLVFVFFVPVGAGEVVFWVASSVDVGDAVLVEVGDWVESAALPNGAIMHCFINLLSVHVSPDLEGVRVST